MVFCTFKSDLQQLWLLLWKNASLQKRSWIGLCLEIILPAFFAIILLPIRSIVKSEKIENDTTYYAFNFDRFPNNSIFRKQWCMGYTPNNDTLVNAIMEKISQNLNFTLNCKLNLLVLKLAKNLILFKKLKYSVSD